VSKCCRYFEKNQSKYHCPKAVSWFSVHFDHVDQVLTVKIVIEALIRGVHPIMASNISLQVLFVE
jgi:hypothetical protein